MKRTAIAIVCVGMLVAAFIVAQDTETPELPPLPSIPPEGITTAYEAQELLEQVVASMEAREALLPSKLEQWQARDDLIELVFDVDEEMAHYLYQVVQAAIKNREKAAERRSEIRALIEANDTRRALR